MKNTIIKHGQPPYNIAVIHGGPGASGDMTPVGRELGKKYGVLEPIQTANSVTGQIKELKTVVQENANLPITIIGHSWGAWLGFMLTAEYPELIRRLILVASGPFEHHYAKDIEKMRLARLTKAEQSELNSTFKILCDSSAKDKTKAFKRFGELFAKTDSFDHAEDNSFSVDFNSEIYNSVWPEAAELRESGKLLELAHKIKCPVVAIHGDYDPHPAEGVEKPLSKIIDNFKFILLEKCGHKPWEERHAKDRFYEVLKSEL